MKNEKQKSLNRRPARVFAMQLLYAMEATKGTIGECLPGILESFEEIGKGNVKSKGLSPEMKAYGMSLVDLVQEHRKELDEIISSSSKSWSMERMAWVDLAILRLGLSELLYKTEIPVKVVLTEAMQIAAKYSTADSSSFVNGILNHFAEEKEMFGKNSRGTENENF